MPTPIFFNESKYFPKGHGLDPSGPPILVVTPCLIWLSQFDNLIRGSRCVWTSINPGATTTITVKGNVSGITKVVSMTVEANPDARVYAKPSVIDVTDPKFY